MKKNFDTVVRKYFKGVILFLILVSLLIDGARFQVSPLDLYHGQTESWWKIAQNVENGNGYKSCIDEYVPNCKITKQYTATREPLPVLLFALIGKLSHDSVLALSTLMILFYFLIAFGMYLLGKRIGTIDVFLLAIVLWTFYLPQESLEGSLTGDLISSAFVVFGFYLFVRIAQQNRWQDWLAFGFVMGLAVLSRSAMLVVAVTLVLGYIVYFHENPVNLGKTIAKGALSLVVLAITISPWVIRNYLVFHQPVIGTTLIGYNLYRHNAIVATGEPPHYVGPIEARNQVQELEVRRPELRTPIDEVQVDAIFRGEAVKLILEHPISYGKLVIYRVLPLLFNIGIAEQYGDSVTIKDYLTIGQQVFFLIAFILGLWHSDKNTRLFGVSILFYCLSYLTVDSQLRYLIPIMPVVIIIGSNGIVKSWSLFSEKRLR